MAGRIQIINRSSKGMQSNILIHVFNFIITTVDCQGGSLGGRISARAFSLARPGVASPLFQTFVSFYIYCLLFTFSFVVA